MTFRLFRMVWIFPILLVCQNVFAQTIVERIEPANWWLDMEHDQIQLMLYGNDIGYLTPESSSESIRIGLVTKVPNPNYLFIDVQIQPYAEAGTYTIVLRDKQEEVTEVEFDLYERKYSDEDIVGFEPSDAIYLITPDRFVNGDQNNDEIAGMKEGLHRKNPGGRHGGDIAGIAQSLDYIADMGFTALWLNPVLENDMDSFSYHGYATTDFYKVDPRYGSNEEYQALAEKARDQGLKLIMDMIVNHCGLNHWWMKDLPTEDWVNQWPEYTQTNHRKTMLQDPYVAEADRKIFTDGWFVPVMPDLNQRNPLMAKYLIQNSIWWIEYLGLSGIRMDTYPYPDMDFMTDWTEAVMKEYPNFNIVGEEWFENPAIVSYWQAGKHNPNGYTSALKSLMDFPLQAEMVRALTAPEAWKSGLIGLYEMLAMDFLYPDPYGLVTFPDNHDMSRIYTQLDEDYDLFEMAMVFTLTTRGIPQIYYGTEILMTNPGTSDHGIIRSDFPGGWLGDEVDAFTGEGLNPEQQRAQLFTKKLLNWRRNSEPVATGKLVHYEPRNGIYVYFRYTEEETVMVVLNKNTSESYLDVGRFSDQIKDYSTGWDVLGETSIDLSGGEILLPPKSGLILELRR